MRMHKFLYADQLVTYCSAWVGGFNHEGFWATRWWKYTTCKRCLAKRTKVAQKDPKV